MSKLYLSVLLNVVIPSLILIFGKGTTGVFLIALAFPIMYGIWSFVTEKKTNFISIIGFVAILLTGGVGLLKLDNQWIVVKEAGIPLLIGLIILFTQWIKKPFVRGLFKEVIDLKRIDEEFKKRGRPGDFEEQLVYTSYFLAGAFFVSAVLNYVLAKIIIVSPTGTEAFNQELGKMTALSFPVIAVPMFIILFFILYYLMSSIKKHTNLEIEDLIKK